MKTIYDLKLHERMHLQEENDDVMVLRVPGGFLYSYNYKFWDELQEAVETRTLTCIFVPWDGKTKID